ncbi:MAG: hypothetical protein QNJ54_25980 [Prochloraceae cyanobacterium]|nr:hypothetical protein [Prochloraceae cyanobacterium]
MPDLLEATKEYWKKLDELEAAYERGQISIEQVDAEVKKLMAELGFKRREALSYFWQSLCYRLQNQPEFIMGLILMAIAIYAWFLLN